MLVIDFWQHNLDTTVTQQQENWRVLDDTEKTQALKFSNTLLQERYINAHGRLRQILAHYLNLNDAPANLVMQKTAHGKPYLPDYPDLAFNLSHTDNVMVVAVAKNCQLGVDIEQCKPRSSMAALVAKCFSDQEAAYWRQLPETEQLQAFYQFWTRKEAFVKATGLGISLGLRDCVLNPNNPQQFLAIPSQCGFPNDWHNRDIALEQGMCAAVVVDKDIANVICCNYCESSDSGFSDSHIMKTVIS